MFSTTIDKILCFWVLIRWRWFIILLVFGTLLNFLILNFPNWNLGLFWFFDNPPTPSTFGIILKFRCFFDWKPSLSLALLWFSPLPPTPRDDTPSTYNLVYNILVQDKDQIRTFKLGCNRTQRPSLHYPICICNVACNTMNRDNIGRIGSFHTFYMHTQEKGKIFSLTQYKGILYCKGIFWDMTSKYFHLTVDF